MGLVCFVLCSRGGNFIFFIWGVSNQHSKKTPKMRNKYLFRVIGRYKYLQVPLKI